jgi:hypothetical protein
MRRKPGATTEEVIESLTKTQRVALDRVSKAQENTRAAEAKQKADLQKAIIKAIDAAIPVPVIAETLGVTRGRVYQMRDEALSPVQ